MKRIRALACAVLSLPVVAQQPSTGHVPLTVDVVPQASESKAPTIIEVPCGSQAAVQFGMCGVADLARSRWLWVAIDDTGNLLYGVPFGQPHVLTSIDHSGATAAAGFLADGNSFGLTQNIVDRPAKK